MVKICESCDQKFESHSEYANHVRWAHKTDKKAFSEKMRETTLSFYSKLRGEKISVEKNCKKCDKYFSYETFKNKPIEKLQILLIFHFILFFPHFKIDNFLEESFAEEIFQSFPSLDFTHKNGQQFSRINEKGKTQLTKSNFFPSPIKTLSDLLSEDSFLDDMSYIFNIPKLKADLELNGGGIHQTGPRGNLDVHIDFNRIKEKNLHRRLNILVYFNKNWPSKWGGQIELWDKNVKNCVHSFDPIFNRCVVFETNEISWHGVPAIKCPEGQTRKSFAAYYYTSEAPSHYVSDHSTIFKARPNEKLKGLVLMPLEKFVYKLKNIRTIFKK